MIIEDVYKESKKFILYNDSIEYQNLRKKILSKFDLPQKNKKNNESLNHIDPKLLEFTYKYKNFTNNIDYVVNDKNRIEINVLDGKIIRIKNPDIKNLDIKIKNIENQNDSVQKKFINYHDFFAKDYILNLNSLFLNSGYELYIGPNQELDIYISNIISEENLTVFQKNIITCSSNSKVKIIEEYLSDKSSINNVVNFIDIEVNSEIEHLIFQKNREKANLLYTSFSNCKNDSRYNQLILNISESSIRNHHYANLLGEQATANLDGIFFASSNQIIDNKTVINHQFPNCKSSQRYKGIVTDLSKASYLSKTFVDKSAQKTEAYQLSKGILLSDHCSFHSKPELRIFADDVKCSHGSTIGPIDRDLLFYLRSRGLDKKSALSLLIKSFFHDIISSIDEKSFLEKFNYHSNIWLKKNNL